jgi:hypothetical protein
VSGAQAPRSRFHTGITRQSHPGISRKVNDLARVNAEVLMVFFAYSWYLYYIRESGSVKTSFFTGRPWIRGKKRSKVRFFSEGEVPKAQVNGDYGWLISRKDRPAAAINNTPGTVLFDSV